jgi:hypothetical protein
MFMRVLVEAGRQEAKKKKKKKKKEASLTMCKSAMLGIHAVMQSWTLHQNTGLKDDE